MDFQLPSLRRTLLAGTSLLALNVFAQAALLVVGVPSGASATSCPIVNSDTIITTPCNTDI